MELQGLPADMLDDAAGERAMALAFDLAVLRVRELVGNVTSERIAAAQAGEEQPWRT